MCLFQSEDAQTVLLANAAAAYPPSGSRAFLEGKIEEEFMHTMDEDGEQKQFTARVVDVHDDVVSVCYTKDETKQYNISVFSFIQQFEAGKINFGDDDTDEY